MPAPFAVEAPHALTGVAAASPSDVWAVGQSRGRPLIVHWDGAGWSTPPGAPPRASLVGAGLEGVTALRSYDVGGQGGGTAEVIAVGGAYDRLLGVEVPLIERWDGASRLEVSAPLLPDAGGDSGVARGYVLTDVTLVAPGEAWAVGHAFEPVGRLVALYGDGDRWRVAEGLPDVPQGKLLAVSGTSAHDVWAVGAEGRSGLIVHFDGTSWRRVPCPSTRSPLSDVTAVAPDDAWCAGGGTVLRWNGRKWGNVKIPIDSANTVTAISSTDVWVGGGRGELAHYDGRRWTPTSAPDPLRDTAVWRGSAVAAHTPGPVVWMVGSRRLGDTTSPSRDHSTTAHEA
ncbi:hypothetical protein [Thermomonospora umbrina]|uniref:hypothetical protein n=1 Tax=Thermomonospora umbrina TaxID=111806 RepID=UPI0011C17C1F|nr:hypothetical protein [Thermomonospora umbrina]